MVGRALAGPQKKAKRAGRTSVWVDETGLYVLPARVRRSAPRGQTPVLRVPRTRDQLSVIGAMTPAGRVVLHVQSHAERSAHGVRCLRHRLRHIPGTVVGSWAGAPIPRSRTITALLASGGAARMQLERLPGEAPERTPVEGSWQDLKRVELRNLCCHTVVELRAELRLALARLRHTRDVVRSFVTHCGSIL